MKKIFLGFLAVALCVPLVFATLPLVVNGLDLRRTADIELCIGASDRFSQEEIASAMNVVKETFANSRNHPDELVSLWYCENSYSHLRVDQERGNIIVIFSTEYRGQGFGNERRLMPWTWILSRENPSDSWIVVGGGKII